MVLGNTSVFILLPMHMVWNVAHHPNSLGPHSSQRVGEKGDAWRHPLFFERHEVEYSHFTFLKNIWSNMHTFTILIMHTLPFFTFDWPEITIHIDTLDARERGKSE